MPRSIDGQKLLQIWQWGQPTQAEETMDEAIALCRQFRFTGVCVKALDGATWMGQITGQQNASEALRSHEDIRRQAEQVHAAGLYYSVWTNPLGEPGEDLTAGSIAQMPEIDAFFLDVEPYMGFWGPWRAVGEARRYMEQIRALAPEAYIVLQPDPRPARLREIRPEEWLPYCNAFAGQHYFSTFQADPNEEIDRAAVLAGELRRDYPHITVGITLPSGTTDLVELDAAVRRLEFHDVPAVVLWRMGDANHAQLEIVGAFRPSTIPEPHDPGPVPSEPGFTPEQQAERLELLRTIREAVDRLEQITPGR